MDKYQRWQKMLEDNDRAYNETIQRTLEKLARYYGDSYGNGFYGYLGYVWKDEEKKNPTQVPPEWGEVSP